MVINTQAEDIYIIPAIRYCNLNLVIHGIEYPFYYTRAAFIISVKNEIYRINTALAVRGVLKRKNNCSRISFWRLDGMGESLQGLDEKNGQYGAFQKQGALAVPT